MLTREIQESFSTITCGLQQQPRDSPSSLLAVMRFNLRNKLTSTCFFLQYLPLLCRDHCTIVRARRLVPQLVPDLGLTLSAAAYGRRHAVLLLIDSSFALARVISVLLRKLVPRMCFFFTAIESQICLFLRASPKLSFSISNNPAMHLYFFASLSCPSTSSTCTDVLTFQSSTVSQINAHISSSRPSATSWLLVTGLKQSVIVKSLLVVMTTKQ